MASSVEQIPSVLVVRQTFEFVVFVVEAEVDAELSQVDQSVLLGPIMTAVYLYGTIISKEDECVFWFIVA
jgi:hypothetical protein